MRRVFRFGVVLSGILIVSVVGITTFIRAEEATSTASREERVSVVSVPSQPLPTLTTLSWGVFDPVDGAITAGVGIDTVHPMASITKLFTAYAVVTAGSTTAPVVVSWSDLNAPGRAGKLTYGEELTQGDLLFPLLLESSNDAGAALERVLGDTFFTSVEKLTRTMSLTDTHVVDATGLGTENVSSVRDLARFYAHVRTEYPHIIDITKLSMYVGPHVGLVNNNPVQKVPQFSGGKHGYTDAAQRTFVGTFTLEGTDREIGVILLGSTDIVSDSIEILTYAETVLWY